MKMPYLALILLSTLMFACDKPANNSVSNSVKPSNNQNVSNTATAMKKEMPVYTYEVVKTFKHDGNAFTQGLVVNNGFFYESTGEYGESSLRKVEIESGKVLQKYDLAKEVFAEGMTIFKDKIYQISWQEETCFVYDMNFKLLKEFKYQGEGWGLTHDGKNLIMSDGTHVIRFMNPETFQMERTITVLQENGRPLMNLNELEYVKGEIWANIWHSEQPDILGKPNHIARIDPNSGKILGWIDLVNISPKDVEAGSENTLNGIAYDETNDRIFVTGKNWKNLFEIKLKPKN
ncbi:MAG: glutaminyl-peptide cyclotransferase [Pyrinomonadaceae bacterium]|jgi:glutamine cyclotransferase|nr:glutaminyl-peptide cyclotransferase [Pyrinomonadaceae bacterium]